METRKSSDESNRLMLQDDKGQELKLADLAGFTGTVHWAIVGSEHVSHRAQKLQALGQQAGAAGDHARALSLFSQAHEEAPEWPYPLYEAGYTHLLMGDLARAQHEYEAVERLAPRGFFTYKPELDCVRRESAGEFAPGTCHFYVAISNMPNSPEKRSLLEKLLERSPRLGPAWEKLAELLKDDDAKLAAIDKGLACMPDVQTRGTLLVNKALIFRRQGKLDQAISILQDLLLEPQTTLDVELTAKVALSQIQRHPSAG